MTCELIVPDLQEENLVLRNVVRKLHHRLWQVAQILELPEDKIIEEIKRLKSNEEANEEERKA
jgi:hypothetical protein